MRLRLAIAALLIACAPASAQFNQGKKFGGQQGFSAPSAAVVAGTNEYSLILYAPNASALSTSTTLYMPPTSAGVAANLNSSTIGTLSTVLPFSSAVTVQNLAVASSTAPTGTAWPFTVYKNEASTAVLCDLITANPCNDVTHLSVTATGGDRLQVQSAPNTITCASCNITWGLLLKSTSGEGALFTALASQAASVTNYAAWGSGTISATQNLAEMVVPGPGTIKRLFWRGSAAQSNTTADWQITVIKDTGCAASYVNEQTIDTNAGGTTGNFAAGTVFSDIATAAFSVVQGDCIQLKIVSNVNATVSGWTAGVVWTPTTNGDYPVAMQGTTLLITASTTRFFGAEGQGSANGTGAESSAWCNYTPQVPTSLTVKNVTVKQDANLTASTGTRTWTLRKGTAQCVSGMAASAALCAFSNTAALCNGSTSDAVTGNNFLDYSVLTGTGTYNATTYARQSFMANVQ